MTNPPNPFGYMIGSDPLPGATPDGRCARCGAPVSLRFAEMIGHVLDAEDGWLTVVCQRCAPEPIPPVSDECVAGRHRACARFGCACECHMREGD